jgi:hypothetical protein
LRSTTASSSARASIFTTCGTGFSASDSMNAGSCGLPARSGALRTPRIPSVSPRAARFSARAPRTPRRHGARGRRSSSCRRGDPSSSQPGTLPSRRRAASSRPGALLATTSSPHGRRRALHTSRTSPGCQPGTLHVETMSSSVGDGAQHVQPGASRGESMPLLSTRRARWPATMSHHVGTSPLHDATMTFCIMTDAAHAGDIRRAVLGAVPDSSARRGEPHPPWPPAP